MTSKIKQPQPKVRVGAAKAAEAKQAKDTRPRPTGG